MTTIEVPGAELYYEAVGTGPMLLCISGANGSCEIWRMFAKALQDHFTVVSWDRRGFSRSYLKGPQDYDQRLETDADDAARLIKHVSPNKPATVIGNSSGAIVALKLLTRHPDVIKTLTSYEPPAARFLPNFDELWATHQDVYNTYRKSGMAPAFDKFAELTKADQAMIHRMLDPKSGQYVSSNLQYWFEREFLYYPMAAFDIDKEIRPLKDKLILVNGELSSKEPYQYRANVELGKKIGLEVVHLPGEHVGHASHAFKFAEKFFETLKEKDQYYVNI